MGYGVDLRVVHCIVSGMVRFSARGTGPRFLGAPVPPDGNVANPTRPGTRLPIENLTRNLEKVMLGISWRLRQLCLRMGRVFPAATLGT